MKNTLRQRVGGMDFQIFPKLNNWNTVMIYIIMEMFVCVCVSVRNKFLLQTITSTVSSQNLIV